MYSASSREINLWWPLPLALLLWLIAIWLLGVFLSQVEDEEIVGVEIPEAIEAEFLELPEPGIPQASAPPPRKGVDTPPQQDSQQAKIKPDLISPPSPRIRPTQPQPRRDRPDTPAKTQPRPQPDDGAPSDLSEYIKQRRSQDQQQSQQRPRGIFDGVERSPNVETKPQLSAEQKRLAKIKRNLEMPGTSGIFQITHMGSRYAQFSFRSWTTGDSNARRQLINVEAGPDGSVERAIIRRMIELIRQYHQEDFNWESHRLNRVIVLSARPGDQEGLENFLMREFFGDPLKPSMR